MTDTLNKQELVQQEKLVLSKGRNPRLSYLYVHPNPTGKRSTGTLEAHVNGFRFVSARGVTIGF